MPVFLKTWEVNPRTFHFFTKAKTKFRNDRSQWNSGQLREDTTSGLSKEQEMTTDDPQMRANVLEKSFAIFLSSMDPEGLVCCTVGRSWMACKDFCLCVEQRWASGRIGRRSCSWGLTVTLWGTDTSESSTQGYSNWLLDQSNTVLPWAPGHPSPQPHIPSITKLMGLTRENRLSLKPSKW